MPNTRPPLTNQLNPLDFLEHYWLLSELKSFCKKEKMSILGNKLEITERIAYYLKTGQVNQSLDSKIPSRKKSASSEEPLSIKTVITLDHTCNEKVRAFFIKIIDKNFHFSVQFQKYFKENIGKTYQDAVTYWYELQKLKKSKTNKYNIAGQFKYNQFTRDFFNDPTNKGKNRQEAIKAWNHVKQTRGNHTYADYLESIKGR